MAQLLVLDEPLAMLDPLARHEFMAGVMAAVADDGLSVVMSSHALAELERVADYLILLADGRVQVAGEVEDLLDRHRMLTGPAAEADKYAERLALVHSSRAQAQAHLLIRTNGTADPVPEGWEAHRVSLEELVLAYLRTWRGGAARSRAAPGGGLRGGDRMTSLATPERAAVPGSQGESVRPVPWRNLAWVIWRQHRLAIGGAGLLLGGFSLVMLINGL